MTSPQPATPASVDHAQVMRTEWKVLGVLGLLLLVIEGALTLAEDQLSVNVHHLRSIPRLTERFRPRSAATAVAEQRQQERPIERWQNASTTAQILFLGSSRQHDGLDLHAFQQQAERRYARPVDIVALHPEGARISEWSYLYRNFLAERDRVPDLLLIGFRHDDLRDAPSQMPTELARFYDCRLDDLGELSRNDLRSIDDWCHFMLSNASAIFAHRRSLEPHLLATFIPGYAIASSQIRPAADPQPPASLESEEYHRLRELIAIAQRDHVEIVLIALPSSHDDQLDPQLIHLARQQQLTLMDCRHPAGFSPDANSVQFSHYLASWLPLQTLLEHRDRRLAPTIHAHDTTRWAGGDQPPRY